MRDRAAGRLTGLSRALKAIANQEIVGFSARGGRRRDGIRCRGRGRPRAGRLPAVRRVRAPFRKAEGLCKFSKNCSGRRTISGRAVSIRRQDSAFGASWPQVRWPGISAGEKRPGGTQEMCCSKRSRFWIWANSTAMPSSKWRTTRARILPSWIDMPISGLTSTLRDAPDKETSTMRQL